MSDDLTETLKRIANDPQNGPETRRAAREAVGRSERLAVVAPRDTSNTGSAGREMLDPNEGAMADAFETEMAWLDEAHDWSDIPDADRRAIVARHLAMTVSQTSLREVLVPVRDTSNNTDEGAEPVEISLLKMQLRQATNALRSESAEVIKLRTELALVRVPSTDNTNNAVYAAGFAAGRATVPTREELAEAAGKLEAFLIGARLSGHLPGGWDDLLSEVLALLNTKDGN